MAKYAQGLATKNSRDLIKEKIDHMVDKKSKAYAGFSRSKRRTQ